MNELRGACESDHWCRTSKGDTFKTTFTWTIEDYINRPEQKGKSGFLFSSIVCVQGPDNKTIKWRFKLYPRGDLMTLDPNAASIFMFNESDFDVKADFQVAVKDGKKPLQLAHFSNPDVYKAKGQGSRSCAKGVDIEVNVDQLKAKRALLSNDKNLTLYIDIIMYADEKILSGSKYSQSQDLSVMCKTQVADDNMKIFTEDQFSDVLIECDGQAFKCHQVILSARSPVFMAMFQAGMKESKTKSVIIRDYNPEVVKEMLHFIYTGSLKDEISEEMAKDLLRAGDQYHLDLLKRVCEEKLCSNLASSNSLDYLVLGNLYHASKLKAMALRLVATNMTDVVNTEDYKSFHRHHPELALEVTLTRFQKDDVVEEEGTERTNGN